MQTVRVVNRILHNSSIRMSLFLINPEERNVFSKNNICRNYAGADVFYAFLMTQKLPDAAPPPYNNENGSSSFSFNPYLTNRFTHRYHMGESTFIFRGFRCDFKILFHFSIKFL